MRRSVLAAADSCRRDIPAQIGGVAPPSDTDHLPPASMLQITRNSKRRARTAAPLKSSHGVRCSQGGNISNRLRVRVITGKAMWVMQMRETERWR
jgi:hypothetical protein